MCLRRKRVPEIEEDHLHSASNWLPWSETRTAAPMIIPLLFQTTVLQYLPGGRCGGGSSVGRAGGQAAVLLGQ